MRSPQETLNDAGLFLRDYASGRYYTTCPRCSSGRQTRHQKLKCVGVTVNGERVSWGCNHCGWTGPEAGASGGFSEPKASYGYGDDVRKVRSGMPNGPKYFWQHLNGGGAWDKGSGGADLGAALYRIDEVRQAIALGEPVLVVEGEKDVDTCWGMGFAATCNAHGAGSWKMAHSEQLRGADLIVLNDNDDPGRQHADAVCECSFSVARSIRRLVLSEDWPAMPVGGDVTDWMNQGGTAAELQELVDNAPLWGPAKPTTDGKGDTVAALPWLDLGLDGVEVPEHEWAVPDRIPQHQVCLFSGHGGTGKSLVSLHLAAAHALGREWLGSLPNLGGAFFLDAEEDVTEIHIRLEAIRRFYDCSYREFVDGGLQVMPLAGRDCLMAVVSPKSGVVTPTAFYGQVLQQAGDLKPINIIIANASNVFAGNENDRSAVQQFIGLMKRLTNASGGSVTLISHSSLAGLSTDTGLSGSTQWHNAVRARMWLHAPKVNGGDESHQPDSDVRQLDFMKNQYGKLGEALVLKWRDGMLLPIPAESDFERAAKSDKTDRMFLEIGRKLQARGQNMSASKTARNYAVHLIFGELPKGDPTSKADLASAMGRLLDAHRVVVLSTSRGNYLRVP